MQHDWITVLGMLFSLLTGVITSRIMQKAPDKQTDGDLIKDMRDQLDEITKRDIKIVELESKIARLNHSIILLNDKVDELTKKEEVRQNEPL